MALHLEFLRSSVSSRLVSTTGGDSRSGLQKATLFRRNRPSAAYWSAELWKTARKLVESTSLVHGHGFYVGTNWILGREARRQHKPLVYHVHGFFEPWILGRSRGKKRLAHWLFEDANFRHAQLWRALTNKEADQIRGQGITAPVVVAANGIHLEAFDTAPAPETTKTRRRCVFMGRLHSKKGLDLLLHAWSELKNAHLDWELLIAGPDEGGYQAVVEKVIKDLGINDGVRLVGAVSGDEKVAFLKSADVFILPSYSEGFSVAILEAMACRVPVVATTACNFPELAKDGGGWECAPEMTSVRKALEEALSSSDTERRERGLAGRRLVEKSYTWVAIAALILEACEEHCE